MNWWELISPWALCLDIFLGIGHNFVQLRLLTVQQLRWLLAQLQVFEGARVDSLCPCLLLIMLIFANH